LQFSSVDVFTGNALQLYLKDNYLYFLTQITEGSEISFDITQDSASKGKHRFKLLIFGATIIDIEQANVNNGNLLHSLQVSSTKEFTTCA
jgi:hypothetical protein